MLDISTDVPYVDSQFVGDTFNIVDPEKVCLHREFRLSAVDVARPTWIVWTTAVRLLSTHLSPSVVQRAQLPGNNPQLFGE
jgi:hypothetical protein|tara:strand:- start:272 stop:514 length:243 start_codon:yes stop_codon:yes gene_type:complete